MLIPKNSNGSIFLKQQLPILCLPIEQKLNLDSIPTFKHPLGAKAPKCNITYFLSSSVFAFKKVQKSTVSYLINNPLSKVPVKNKTKLKGVDSTECYNLINNDQVNSLMTSFDG